MHNSCQCQVDAYAILRFISQGELWYVKQGSRTHACQHTAGRTAAVLRYGVSRCEGLQQAEEKERTTRMLLGLLADSLCVGVRL